MKFDVRGDVKQITEHLNSLSKRHVPFALAASLTKTAQFTSGKLRDEMKRSFDRPTPFTLNSLYVSPATKQNLSASVKIKDEALKGNAAIKFLGPEIYGGSRSMKASEHLLNRAGVLPAGWSMVPASGAQLDGYGNLPRGVIQRILSQLSASRDSLQNATPASKRRSRKRVGGQYFAAIPGRARTAHLKPGIYERFGFAVGSAIRPVLMFIPRMPRYRQRYKFFEIADQVARMRWPTEFAIAMRKALETAK